MLPVAPKVCVRRRQGEMNRFESNVWLQTAGLPAILLGVLLATAGTPWYWEAWLYCGVLHGVILWLTDYLLKHDRALLERRLRIGTVGEHRPAQRWFIRLAGVLFLATYVVSGLQYRWEGPLIPMPLVILANLGVVLCFWMFLRVMQANSFASSIVEVTQDQSVIETGPYGIVRHPMYAACLLWFICTPIALGTWWALMLLVPDILVLMLRLLDEERLLVTELSGYRAYCQKTPYRLIPGVW
jgi:protein-S-isoprenylcysteine O-methyltransferase Ste14